MNQYHAHGRDMLADLIEAIPMDEPSEIILVTDSAPTVFKFPAVMNADGSEIVANKRGYWIYNRTAREREWKPSDPTPAEHIEFQIKRRARIARHVRKLAKRYFE